MKELGLQFRVSLIQKSSYSVWGSCAHGVNEFIAIGYDFVHSDLDSLGSNWIFGKDITDTLALS
jgi:hypothetical protein